MYQPHIERGVVSGSPLYLVRRNGWEIVEHCSSLAAAQQQAAALNFQHDTYPRLQKIGLDGVHT